MAGGLFEGLKKCYCGKNVTQKHLIILFFCFLLTLPTAIAQSKLGLEAEEAEIYGYLFQHPVLLILLMLMSFVLMLYLINFTHNALKFFIWSDTQDDPEKINAIQIMPEFNKQIFSYVGQYLGFSAVWFLIFAVLFIALIVVTTQIPVVGGILLALAMFFVLISSPHILVGFAKTYKIKGNISPLLLFTYTKGTILSTAWLYIKLFGLSILLTFGFVIACFIVGVVLGMLGFNKDILQNLVIVSILSTGFAYISMLIYFAFYYSAAFIYFKKIEK